VKLKVTNVLKEYCDALSAPNFSGDGEAQVADVVVAFKNLPEDFGPDCYGPAMKIALNSSMELKPKQRAMLPAVLVALAVQKAVPVAAFDSSLRYYVGILADLEMDVPGAGEYVATLIGELIVAKQLPLKFLSAFGESVDLVEFGKPDQLAVEVLAVVSEKWTPEVTLPAFKETGIELVKLVHESRAGRGGAEDLSKLLVERGLEAFGK